MFRRIAKALIGTLVASVLLTQSALAAFTVNNVGTVSGSAGATLALTLSCGTNPAVGSVVFLSVTERNTTATVGTFADSGSNTWTQITSTSLSNSSANGWVQTYYSVLTTGLTCGSSTITFTRGTSGTVTAFSATNILGALSASPLDSGTKANATFTAANCLASASVTAALAPAVANELWVATTHYPGTQSFTQAGGWSTPPTTITSGAAGTDAATGGGNLTDPGSTTETYTPTAGASAVCTLTIQSFKPAVSSVGGLLVFGVGS